jgi:hypothetical protein
VDRQQEPALDFQVGQQVYVHAENISTTQPSKKLSEKYLGPFKIIAHPGTHSFTLWLPKHLCAMNRTQPPPPPVKINDVIEYEIAEILNSKIDNRQKCKLLYFVRWAGYEGTDEESSWLLANELDHAQEIVMDFHSHYHNKPGPLPL